MILIKTVGVVLIPYTKGKIFLRCTNFDNTIEKSFKAKYVISIIFLPFCQIYKKVVLRLSEHGDIIETQTIITRNITQTFSPSKFFSKFGLCREYRNSAKLPAKYAFLQDLRTSHSKL